MAQGASGSFSFCMASASAARFSRIQRISSMVSSLPSQNLTPRRKDAKSFVLIGDNESHAKTPGENVFAPLRLCVT
jgi:hypothetical protein